MGVIEMVVVFVMVYWFLEREGVKFGDLWFGFGRVLGGMLGEEVVVRLNVVSLVYFVMLVVV